MLFVLYPPNSGFDDKGFRRDTKLEFCIQNNLTRTNCTYDKYFDYVVFRE